MSDRTTNRPERAEPAGGGPQLHRLLPIASPDFWRLWFVGLIMFIVRWLEMLAMAVFVYEETRSPFIVATLTMLRLLPMALFGAFMGEIADRIERRTVLIGVVVCLMATSGTLALLAHFQALAVWHLTVATFVNGTTWATDNPVRRIMIGEVVERDRIGVAMSIDIGTNNASRLLGPAIGGVLFATVGLEGIFALSVASYAVATVTAFGLRYRNVVRVGDGGKVLRRIAEGLAIVRRDRQLLGALSITVIFNVFGWPFTSMIPVIGHDDLLLTPTGVGLLASMDGLGAFVGAVAIAWRARPHHYARLYIGGTACYLVLLCLFALTPVPLLAGGALLLTGLVSAGFTIMQSTLIYILAPIEIRSRVFGVLSVCIGSGPIGFLHLGLLANAIGASAATATIGVEGLIVLALTRNIWRPVWRSAMA